jgi:hypothetical protein
VRRGFLGGRRQVGLSLVLAGAIATAACSVATYEKPVTDFAAAVEDAENALAALNTEVTDAYAAAIRRQVVAGDGLVRQNPATA